MTAGLLRGCGPAEVETKTATILAYQHSQMTNHQTSMGTALAYQLSRPSIWEHKSTQETQGHCPGMQAQINNTPQY